MWGFGTHEVAGARLERLNRLVVQAWAQNRFYLEKWLQAGLSPRALKSLEELGAYPLVTRPELVLDQAANPPLGTNLTEPQSAFKRVHRSSGTTRAPLFWGDTSATWDWVIGCSRALFECAGVRAEDRVLVCAPFGGSSGSWIIYEGALRLGCGCFAVSPSDADGFGVWLNEFHPNVVVGRPSALLHLFEATGGSRNRPTPELKKLILTGETVHRELRAALEEISGAACFDRYGLTEAGSVAAECERHSGLHVLDDEFIMEVIDPVSGKPLGEGALGELVLTNLGRTARPIIRYRTGDLTCVAAGARCGCGRGGPQLTGGIRRVSPAKPEMCRSGCSQFEANE